MAAAMVGILVGGGATTLATSNPPPQPAAGATSNISPVSTELGPLSDEADTAPSGAAGVQASAGQQLLAVSTAGLQPAAGYYEVWLIDLDTMDMVSLGSIAAGDGVVMLRVPDGVDLATYSVVDISDEPVNGDPTHSGDSVLRGTLPV